MTKLSELSGFLKFTRQDLNLENRPLCYKTIIEPIISSALLVYGSTNSNSLHTIFLLQKQFRRFIFGEPHFAHSSRLFELSCIQTVHECYASALTRFFGKLIVRWLIQWLKSPRSRLHYLFSDQNLSKNRSKSFLLNIEPLKGLTFLRQVVLGQMTL